MNRRNLGFLNGVLLVGLFALAADAAVITGTFTPIRAGAVVDLTREGALDWVHWGLYTETSLNRKANVTPQIGDFSLVTVSNFFGFAYQYADNYNGYSWQDGTPVRMVTDTRTGVYTVGLSHGFQVRVPAGTGVKRLKMYVGTYGARGRFQASLSDFSATPYVNDTSIDNTGNGPGGVYTIDFSSRSPGASLIIKWIVAEMHDPIYGNVTLQAAALTSSTANNPPFVAITSPAQNAAFTAPADISVAADAVDFDGTIAKVEFFNGSTKLGEDTSSPFGYSWRSVPAGNYTLFGRATDNEGETSDSAPIDVFVYGSGGSLSGTEAQPPRSVDLTAEGSTDWAHWGHTSSTSFDHKAGVTQQISDFTKIGNDPVERYTNNYTGYNWTDGTPHEEAVNSTTGIFTTGYTNGFEVTAPADMLARTLKVYVGLYGAEGTFQAFLSDASARPYIPQTFSNVFGDSSIVYTLSYSAASAGQTLIARFRSKNLFDTDYGNVTLQSATLVGASSSNQPPVVQITSPTNNAVFTALADITLQATASDSDGSIAKVEFFSGATKLGEDTSSPYSFVWNSVPAGSYSLTARARDNLGATALSAAVGTIVRNPVTSFRIRNVAVSENTITFSFPTEGYWKYTVFSSSSLAPARWGTLRVISGNGSEVTVSDETQGSGLQRFYKVLAE